MALKIQQILQQAVTEHSRGNLEEAQNLYRSILMVQPEHPDANHNLGLIAVSKNQPASAIPLFKRALNSNLNVEQFWISYVGSLFKDNQIKEAARLIKKAKKLGLDSKRLAALNHSQGANYTNKEPPQEQVNALLQLLQAKNYDSAEELALTLTRKFPRQQISFKVLGVILTRTGRASEALKPSQKSVELSPQDAEAHYNLGIILYELGQFNEARSSYKQAISLKPDHAQSYFGLGNTLKQLNRSQEAIDMYRTGLLLEPNYAKGYFNLGNIYRQTGQLNEAESNYRHAITLDPLYIDAHINLSNTLQELGNHQQAGATLRDAILIDPSAPEVHYNLGNILYELGELQQAKACFIKSISLQPGHEPSLNNLGNILTKLERFDESELIYRELLSLNKTSPEAHYNLGTTLRCLGRLEESAESLRQAIALRAGYIDAHNNLAGTLKELGQYKDALSHYDFLNNPDAQAQSLECLYFDGDYSAFDKRLNLISKLENTNLRVSAISAFSANQRGKTDPYLFCQNPLDFVMTSNLSEYDPKPMNLINHILKESARYNLIWESRTTKFGFQSPNDLFQNPSEHILKLEKIIQKAIIDYYDTFKEQSNTLISLWPKKYKLIGWYNRLLKNGFQTAHIHPGGWLSGVIYLKTIEPSNSTEGAIEFGLHGYDLPIINPDYPKKIFQPVTGDIVLFPSSLFHRTIPFTTDTERCVIAFDLVRV